ncbi:MAG TPA: GAF domain-containing protein [Ardenticatenaceae bacterium]
MADTPAHAAARAALRESEAMFEALLDTASLGIIIADEAGRILLANARAAEMFGYDREELTQQVVESLLPARYRKDHIAHRAQYRVDPGIRAMGHGRDLSARRKDGTEFPVEIGLSFVRAAEGMRVMSFITDISARKQAEMSMRQYASRLETLQEIDRAILAAESPEEVATVALERLAQLVPSARSRVTLFKGEASRPLVLADGPHAGGNGSSEPGHAELEIPLLSQGHRIGTLQLGAVGPDGFTEEQGDIAREVANLLAIAIQQAQLRADLERHAAELEGRVAERTQEVERRREVAEVLRDILASLNSDRPLAEVLDYIVSLAGRVLGTDASALYHLPNPQGPLTIGAARGLSAEYVTRVRIPIGLGPVGRAVSEQRPIAVSDMLEVLPEYAGLEPEQREILTDLATRYRARLAVPLLVKGEAYGSIILYYAEPRDFSEEEIGLAVTFGDQAALAIENARLRSQVEQSAVAAERSRLARDLHDAVTQTLFSASLIAEVLPRLWQRNPAEGERRLEELRQLTRGALAEMRALLFELRPAVLIKTELSELLNQLGQAITGRARVPVTVTVEGQGKLPPEVQLAFYRIAQETLNNVAKHAGATEVSVSLRYEQERDGQRVTLRIKDNGRGFDPAAVPPERLGLDIMRERVATIGAELTLQSEVEQGTEIAVSWREGGEEEHS